MDNVLDALATPLEDIVRQCSSKATTSALDALLGDLEPRDDLYRPLIELRERLGKLSTDVTAICVSLRYRGREMGPEPAPLFIPFSRARDCGRIV